MATRRRVGTIGVILAAAVLAAVLLAVRHWYVPGGILAGVGAGVGAFLGVSAGNKEARKVEEYRRQWLESRRKRTITADDPDSLSRLRRDPPAPRSTGSGSPPAEP